jgi:hypothetical protein
MINAGSIRSGGNSLGKSSALIPGNPIAAKEDRTFVTDGWKNEFAGFGVGAAVVDANIMGTGGALCASMFWMRSVFSC